MNNKIIRNILRFIGLMAIQIVVLQRLDLSIGNFNYIHVLIYPFIILMLPIDTPKPIVLLLSFAIGIFIDFFYNSPGVHAAALVMTGYIRLLVLRMLEPYEGYASGTSPTLAKMGLTWFISYIGIMAFIHCFAYFSFEAFSFVYFFDIFMNTIFTVIPSLLVFSLIHSIFGSKI